MADKPMPPTSSSDSVEALKEKAGELADCQDILSLFENDLRSIGFAGSTNLPKLIYLGVHTRRFNKPVSMLIKGPSGSGKSFAVNSTLKFFPEEAKEVFSGMSERALIYSGLNLKNKLLAIQEAAGLREGPGRAFIRQLLSEGEVRYQTVQSTQSGLVGKELPRLTGPTSLIMTTTANSIHPEDESRMLLINMPESAEAIRSALMATARVSQAPTIDFGRWHAFDRWMTRNTGSISVPFQDEIGRRLPTSHYRIPRDFAQLLSLIQAHALLHRRAADEEGNITASLDDYEAVYHLVNAHLSVGLASAVPSRISETVNAVIELNARNGNLGVSQRELATFLKRDPSVVSRNVWACIDEGFLCDRNPGQGRIGSLVVGARALPNQGVLPEPGSLRGAVSSPRFMPF